MKRLFFFPVIFICFAACKKMSKQELELTNARAEAALAIPPMPVPPYSWRSMPVPQMNGAPYNHSGYPNAIIPVNGEIFCLMSRPLAHPYKFNKSTKEWEIFSDVADMFRPLRESNLYLFSYGTKIYNGFAWFDFTRLNNFESIDVVTGAITRLRPFPGIPVENAACFVVGNKGYILGGQDWNTGRNARQLWEYDFATDQWTNKGNGPLGYRSGATALVVGNKVYMGFGNGRNSAGEDELKKDWKVYDPATNSSTSLATFPGDKRTNAAGFVLNTAPYIGFGYVNGLTNNNNKYWKYSPATNTWSPPASIPGVTKIEHPGTFTLGGSVYLVAGALYKFWRFTNSMF